MTTFGVGGNYMFRNLVAEDQLVLQANLRFGNVTSKSRTIINTAPTTTEVKYNRNFFSFRVNYSLSRYGNFGFITDILTYSGDTRDYSDFIYTFRYDITF
jgi:hypothetical protein